FFLKKRKEGVLPITHIGMTRFNITLEEGVDMVLHAIDNAWGGELFVPKIPSYRITDVAKAIAPNCKQEVVGIRPGEKLHEEMITETDSLCTYDCGKYYVIAPSVPRWDMSAWQTKFNAKIVEEGFRYNSGTNTEWLTPEDIRVQIKKHVDSTFEVE
ncbi:MAG: polysaccharide biosynthesis protein, partial [Bacteriovorax sp.]|nr:polysaccharide biosynthesis protein [Bacteriovorax sp.]